jgi:hypothetical protein
MKPTWGLYIPGYSYPSVKQQKAFKRMYPDVYAEHEAVQYDIHKEAAERQRAEKTQK